MKLNFNFKNILICYKNKTGRQEAKLIEFDQHCQQITKKYTTLENDLSCPKNRRPHDSSVKFPYQLGLSATFVLGG